MVWLIRVLVLLIMQCTYAGDKIAIFCISFVKVNMQPVHNDIRTK